MAGHLDRVLLSLCFLVPTNLGLSSEISYTPPPPAKILFSLELRGPQSSYDVTRREQMRVVPDENVKGEKIKDSALAPSPPVLVTSVLLKPKHPVATTGERFLSFSVDFSPLQTKGKKAGRLSLWQQECVLMAVHVHTQEAQSYWNPVGMTYK